MISSCGPNVEDPATQYSRPTDDRAGRRTRNSHSSRTPGCHTANISHEVLNGLAKLPYDGSEQPAEGQPKSQHVYVTSGKLSDLLAKIVNDDPPAVADWDGKLADTKTDCLANEGAEL
ncbi:hypothetical protein LTS17_001238 [Exophiala oligosperma]